MFHFLNKSRNKTQFFLTIWSNSLSPVRQSYYNILVQKSRMTAGSCVQLLCCTLSDEILKGSSDQKSDLNQPHTAESHTNARIFFKVWHSTSFACVPRIHHKYHRATCRVLKTWKVNPRVKLFRYKRWLLRLPLYHFYCYMARLVVWILNDLGLSFLILSAKGDKIIIIFTLAASLLTAHYLSDVNCIRPNSLYHRFIN